MEITPGPVPLSPFSLYLHYSILLLLLPRWPLPSFSPFPFSLTCHQTQTLCSNPFYMYVPLLLLFPQCLIGDFSPLLLLPLPLVVSFIPRPLWGTLPLKRPTIFQKRKKNAFLLLLSSRALLNESSQIKIIPTDPFLKCPLVGLVIFSGNLSVPCYMKRRK